MTANGALMGDMGFSGGGAGAPPRVAYRRDLYDAVVGVMLVIFLVFFFVGERIEGLPIPIRIEDFMFLLLIPFGYRYLSRPKGKLFWWITAYFGLNAIPYGAAIFAGQYDLSVYPIIMMKELQYFYVAYLICQHRAWWVLGTVDALALVIVGNGVRAILQGDIDYYGIGTLGNYLAPSLAGALYLFSTIWLHTRSKLLPTRGLRFAALSVVALGALCAVATVSRSTIAALVAYFGTYLVLANVLALPAFLVGLGLTPAIIQAVALSLGATYGLLASRLLARAAAVGASAGFRAEKWQGYLLGFQPADYVFGRGKGYPNAVDQTFGLGVDSQYVRVLVEEGIVGVVIVAVILLTMLSAIKKRGGEYQHAWGTVAAMMVMSVGLEAMQISKSGGFFWLLMFYFLMCQRRDVPAANA